MSNPSSHNENEKREQTNKAFPYNFASKLVVKSPDGLKTYVTQPQMRVLTHAVPPSVSTIPTASTTGQTIISTIVPQTYLKQVAYHVPRGPAAVANIAVPRGGTPLRGITVSQQTAAVRQLAPSRTPSPANVIQTIQTTNQVGTPKTGGQNPLLVTQSRNITTPVTIMQGRGNVVPRGQPITTSAVRPASAVIHSTFDTTVGATQIQTYKPVVPVQTLGTSLTVSQVNVSKAVGPQTLVYTTVTSAQHINPNSRLAVTTTPQRQVATTNRTVSIPTTNAQAARLAQSGTVLTAGRVAAVVVSKAAQTKLAFTPSISGNPTVTVGASKVITHPPQSSIQIAQVQTPSSNIAPCSSLTFTAAMAKLQQQQQQQQQQQNSGSSLKYTHSYVERSGLIPASEGLLQSATEQNMQVSIGKQTSSPRPSILRKRENDGSSTKAAKNLTPMLTTLATNFVPPVSPPSRPDSRGTGQSSAGSTTISATSSPGPDESPSPPTNVNPPVMMPRDDRDCEDSRPPTEMSPRKKPRKQQLTGNDLQESKFDIQFLSERVKEEPNDSNMSIERSQTRGIPEVTVKKPLAASLLNSYHQTWKPTNNHFHRYTDVKPKEERPQSIMDIANQKRISQKINGWKIYHITSQMEDLSDIETQVYSKLTTMLESFESKTSVGCDKDYERINDLIKGNMQRSKIINDEILEAKTQLMKIFNHKVHAADIINRCASKRNYKKREKS